MLTPELQQAMQRIRNGSQDQTDLEILRRAVLASQVTLAAGERAIACGSVNEAVLVTGDGNIIAVFKGPDAETIRQTFQQALDVIAADRYASALQEYFLALREYCKNLPYLTLYGVRPHRRLDEVYVPLRVCPRPSERELVDRDAETKCRHLIGKQAFSIAEVLHKTESPHLLILGRPGAGKSTLLRQLAECAWDAPQAIGLEKPHLPMLVPLRALALANGALEERLATALKNTLPLMEVLPAGFFRAWSQQMEAPWLLLLDGLDEVPEDRCPALMQWLGGILTFIGDGRVLITARPSVYESEKWDKRLFSTYDIQPFTPEQTRTFAEKWLDEESPDFLNALQNVGNGVLSDTPLLLTIAARVYLKHKEETGVGSLPERRSQLYEEYINTWLREAELRGLRAELGNDVADVAKPALARLALAMTEYPEWVGEDALARVTAEYLSEELNLGRDRAMTAGCHFVKVMGRRSGIFLHTGQTYNWLHPTFREYLAAWAMNNHLYQGKTFATVLGERFFSTKWDESIIHLAGICDQPNELVMWIAQQAVEKRRENAALLAYFCWRESKTTIRSEVRDVVVNALIIALQGSHPYERARAAWALGKIGDSMAIDQLIVALQDPHATVREEAARALGKIGNTRALEILITALGDVDVGVRRMAALALGDIGDPSAVTPLITALGDRDWDLPYCAAISLVRIGKPAVEPLIAVLEYKKQTASKTYKTRRTPTGELVLELEEEKWLELLDDVILNPDARKRWLAVRALGAIGDSHALPALQRIAQEDNEKPFLGLESRVADAAEEAIVRIRQRMPQFNSPR